MIEYIMTQCKRQIRNFMNQIHQYKKLRESEFSLITN